MAARRRVVAVVFGMLGAALFTAPSQARRIIFTGANLGAIPDGPAGCADFGPARDVTFAVTDLVAPLGSVQAFIILNPVHTWVGDLEVELIAPNGASQILFSRTGAIIPTSTGDSSDAAGPYVFVDHFDTGPGNWWSAAAAAGAGVALPTARYRTSIAGGSSIGGRQTLTNPLFSLLTTAQINGTWTLRFRDHCQADTGTVSAAFLALMNPTVLDYDGDGDTDYVVVRNTGGGPTGEITWIASVPPSPLFYRDGFESGDTSKWSLAVP